MQFDDRLSTVLRKRAGSEAAARTQFRQLLDLLGSSKATRDPSVTAEAGMRLAELTEQLAPEVQTQILREPGLRLRNPELVEALAWCEPKISASSMAMARLREQEWLAIIPRLPTTARGFLRHRRDLPGRVSRQLEQLGVHDLVLADPGMAEFEAVELAEHEPPYSNPPPPATAPAEPVARQAPAPIARPAGAPKPAPLSQPVVATAPEAAQSPDSIANLLQRIERFRGTRRAPIFAPRLPLGDAASGDASGRIDTADFASDAQGIVSWGSLEVAPWLVGMALTSPRPGPLVRHGSDQIGAALRRHHPLTLAPMTIDAAPGISGHWLIDAAPVFAAATGAFEGYRGRLRRAPEPPEPPVIKAANTSTRELLHELRTPVNAIQGFAEIIQQQLFGPVPHQYRAHAAGIAVDAAKLLAGFDEVDRLTQLESGALAIEDGHADLRQAISETLRRLTGVLEPRGAGFDLTVTGSPFLTTMSGPELAQLIWRILATAAGSLGMGELLQLDLITKDERLCMKLDWPVALHERLAGNRKAPQHRPAVSAGMFHPRFTLRLAAAEAHAASGRLKLGDKRITLTLPSCPASGTCHDQQIDDATQMKA